MSDAGLPKVVAPRDGMQGAVTGCLLGCAVGDAIGLPYEGLSPRRAMRMLGEPERHRFLLGHGMMSDDTEHTCMVAQALLASGGEPERFGQSLAWRFRFWLLALPAGVGLATARALIKLWLGFGYRSSGVFSAGNGPAMRAPVLGAAIDDPQRLRELVRVSTRITHTDPKAEYGAWAVALAARHAGRAWRVGAKADDLAAGWLAELENSLKAEGEGAREFLGWMRNATEAVAAGVSTEAYAKAIGQGDGVSGYVAHTVPVAVHAWLAHPQDFRGAVSAAIRCGGDADTVAAIVGGIVGAGVGKEGIPTEWLGRLTDWPRSTGWMERLGGRLAESCQAGTSMPPVFLHAWGIVPRNLLFLVVVLFHGFRRLLPPY